MLRENRATYSTKSTLADITKWRENTQQHNKGFALRLRFDHGGLDGVTETSSCKVTNGRNGVREHGIITRRSQIPHDQEITYGIRLQVKTRGMKFHEHNTHGFMFTVFSVPAASLLHDVLSPKQSDSPPDRLHVEKKRLHIRYKKKGIRIHKNYLHIKPPTRVNTNVQI